jgi:hypothetical protein
MPTNEIEISPQGIVRTPFPALTGELAQIRAEAQVELNPNAFQEKAIKLVTQRVEEIHSDESGQVPDFDVYVVWFCKTLQNWKALLSTTIPDGRYYEVTFDGDKGCVYVDTYVKEDNRKALL